MASRLTLDLSAPVEMTGGWDILPNYLVDLSTFLIFSCREKGFTLQAAARPKINDASRHSPDEGVAFPAGV